MSWWCQNFRAWGVATVRVGHPVEERLEAEPPAVLDALLPLRGQLPGQVAGGDHQVHLEPVEGRERRGDVLGVDVAEQLVAEHGRAGVLAARPCTAAPTNPSPAGPAPPAGVVAGELERGGNRPLCCCVG